MAINWEVNKGGCWIWKKSKTVGYGSLTIHDRPYHIHKLMYRIFIKELDRHDTIDHLCRNRACFNPAHMEPVIMRENIRRGDSAKLTWKDVIEIRKMRELGFTHEHIAKIYHVSSSNICMVLKNTWNNNIPLNKGQIKSIEYFIKTKFKGYNSPIACKNCKTTFKKSYNTQQHCSRRCTVEYVTKRYKKKHSLLGE